MFEFIIEMLFLLLEIIFSGNKYDTDSEDKDSAFRWFGLVLIDAFSDNGKSIEEIGSEYEYSYTPGCL